MDESVQKYSSCTFVLNAYCNNFLILFTESNAAVRSNQGIVIIINGATRVFHIKKQQLTLDSLFIRLRYVH